MKFTYILASNQKYLPGVTAIFNSLEKLKNIIDVHFLEYKVDPKYLEELKKYSYNIKVAHIDEKEVEYLGEAEVLMRKRYSIAANLQYDAVCILDADFFILSDPVCYFRAAAAGMVVGVTLEQKRRYGDENHKVDGNFLIKPDFWNDRDICCAPIFINPNKWGQALRETYEIVIRKYGQVDKSQQDEGRFKAPDMDAINICLLRHGSYPNTMCLDQHTWSGLHESLMKIFTRAVVKHGRLFTEDGREIFMIHGQWWNKIWRGWQIDNQMGMIDREINGSQRCKQIAQESFDLVCKWYKDIATGGPININNYLPEGITDVMEIV